MIKLEIKHGVSGHAPGTVVTVQTDENGVPLEKFWRNRLKDAEVDNCVEVVKPSKSETKESKK